MILLLSLKLLCINTTSTFTIMYSMFYSSTIRHVFEGLVSKMIKLVTINKLGVGFTLVKVLAQTSKISCFNYATTSCFGCRYIHRKKLPVKVIIT
jgi:hypothetical protein